MRTRRRFRAFSRLTPSPFRWHITIRYNPERIRAASSLRRAGRTSHTPLAAAFTFSINRLTLGLIQGRKRSAFPIDRGKNGNVNVDDSKNFFQKRFVSEKRKPSCRQQNGSLLGRKSTLGRPLSSLIIGYNKPGTRNPFQPPRKKALRCKTCRKFPPL